MATPAVDAWGLGLFRGLGVLLREAPTVVAGEVGAVFRLPEVGGACELAVEVWGLGLLRGLGGFEDLDGLVPE